MMSGEIDGVEVAAFDYDYTVHSGGMDSSSTTYHQSVLFFRSRNLNLPEFVMRPEGVFHKIGGVFGYQDIDFKSHSIFSSKYLLRGCDESEIRMAFNSELLGILGSKQKINVEGHGDQLIFYRHKKLLKPDKMEAFMEEGLQLLAHFTGTALTNLPHRFRLPHFCSTSCLAKRCAGVNELCCSLHLGIISCQFFTPMTGRANLNASGQPTVSARRNTSQIGRSPPLRLLRRPRRNPPSPG